MELATNQFQIRFVASDVGEISVIEGGIDAVSVVAVVCSASCPADFNGDGFVDFFDYDDYVNCFENAVCPPGKSADSNNDGFVDFFDYDDFVVQFAAGC